MMDSTETRRCTQRGCVNFGLWHGVNDQNHRARTMHTKLATVTVEKVGDDDLWTVWATPHHGERKGPISGPDDLPSDDSPEGNELRAAVLYALRTAGRFGARK